MSSLILLRITRHTFTPTNLNKNILRRLRNNDTDLKRVIFCSRDLGSEGTYILAGALRYNTNLTALDLSSNSIGLNGIKAITKLLQYQTMMSTESAGDYNDDDNHVGGIKTLILSDNNLRNDEGMNVMADALENSLLEHLWLDENCISAAGLNMLARGLKNNTRLHRLHISHNTFQSLSPLISCTFDKSSFNAVADSNHSLKHVFLNCGYGYECEELESIMKINRLGAVKAKRRKIALYIEEDIGRLLNLDVDTTLLPNILSMISQQGNTSTMLRLMQNLPSILYCQGINQDNVWATDDAMDIEYLS